MKKKILFGGIAVVLLAAIAAAAYWFLLREEPKTPRYKRDPKAWEVPPVAYSMKGKTFAVPDQPDTKVVMNLIAPGTKYDYPMGTFAVATGTGEGQLSVLDEFATHLEGGLRAVPIIVSNNGTGQQVYLAVIEENDERFEHVRSAYLGDRIRVSRVSRNGNQVTVEYFVHDRNQPMAEIPSVNTSAIVDISNGVFVQEGRKPWLDAMYDVKQFTGVYEWQKTVAGDGSIVTPSKPEVFTLRFDGPRVSLGTDCNTGSSEVALPTGTSTAISFGPVATTKMFCQSSEEGPYFDTFGKITAYDEAVSGQLTFTLNDGGEMIFHKAGQKLEFENADNEGDAATTTE